MADLVRKIRALGSSLQASERTCGTRSPRTRGRPINVICGISWAGAGRFRRRTRSWPIILPTMHVCAPWRPWSAVSPRSRGHTRHGRFPPHRVGTGASHAQGHKADPRPAPASRQAARQGRPVHRPGRDGQHAQGCARPRLDVKRLRRHRGGPNPATELACRPTHETAKFLSTLAAKEASLPEIRQGRAMDDEHRELVRRLFVTAAEMTETAHEAAIAGQSEALNRQGLRRGHMAA